MNIYAETSSKGTAIDLDSTEQRKNFLNAKTQCMSRGERAVPNCEPEQGKVEVPARGSATFEIELPVKAPRNFHTMSEVDASVRLAYGFAQR